MAQIRAHGGEVILRYNSGAFPLLDPRRAPFDPLEKLRTLEIGQTGEWEVQFAAGGAKIAARLRASPSAPD